MAQGELLLYAYLIGIVIFTILLGAAQDKEKTLSGFIPIIFIWPITLIVAVFAAFFLGLLRLGALIRKLIALLIRFRTREADLAREAQAVLREWNRRAGHDD